jgi:hypothetical protein
MVEDREEGFGWEGEPREEIERVLGAEVFAFARSAPLPIEGIQVPELELHGVCARVGGEVHQSPGKIL